MSDLISRQLAIDALKKYEELESDNFTDTSPITMMAVATIANCIEAIVDLPSAEPERKWISVTEALPTDGSLVIACSPYGGITIVYFRKGISQEDRTKMKNGEIDDPSEEAWCLSEGYSKSKRSDLFKEEDEWGNNQKAYAWQYGPFHYSGQAFVAWMPLPKPYRGDQ